MYKLEAIISDHGLNVAQHEAISDFMQTVFKAAPVINGNDAIYTYAGKFNHVIHKIHALKNIDDILSKYKLLRMLLQYRIDRINRGEVIAGRLICSERQAFGYRMTRYHWIAENGYACEYVYLPVTNLPRRAQFIRDNLHAVSISPRHDRVLEKISENGYMLRIEQEAIYAQMWWFAPYQYKQNGELVPVDMSDEEVEKAKTFFLGLVFDYIKTPSRPLPNTPRLHISFWPSDQQ